MLLIRNLNLFKRYYSSIPARHILEHLKERSLLSISGPDVSDFLQGLITNDIHHLGLPSGGSMYTMFLNTRGRILYDTIIYRTEESETYFVECDKEAIAPLQKHLKMYRIRRKVNVKSLDGEYEVYSLFNINSLNVDNHETNVNNVGTCDKLNSKLPEVATATKTFKDLLIFKDPRVTELGSRIITKAGSNVKKQISEIVNVVDSPQSHETYRAFRYNLGIGEGVKDLPTGNCFPLECNGDYLHGVSFHKGCYIGQELTARTYHTGVVRKRLMPLYFKEIPTKFPVDNAIIHRSVNLGKLRGVEGNVGLALLRIANALEFGEFVIGNGVATVRRPGWWPVEAPKEKMNIERN